MAEISADFSERCEALEADTEDKTQSLKPHAQAHLLSATEYCKICGERAARHVHYGATTCFSCRAFFRRSLQNNTAAKYICRRRSECDINCKTRRNCQYCRYMKCLSVGMNPNYVLTEEEKHKRFHKKKGKRGSESGDDVMEISSQTGLRSELINNDESSEEIQDERKYLPPRPVDQNIVFGSRATAGEEEGQEKISSAPTSVIASPSSSSSSCPNNRNSIIVRNNNTMQQQEFKKEVKELLRSPQEAAMHMTKQEAWSPLPDGDNFSSIKSDLVASLPESNIWCSNDENIFGSQQTPEQSFQGNSLTESLQSVLQPDKMTEFFESNMLYNANVFDDIETTDFDGGSTAESFRSEERMERMEDEGPRMMTDAEKAEISAVVESHDKSYFSVNFGEVLIKEMLMCSMFGVQISTSSALQAYKLQVERITRIANSLPSFTSLASSDQVALLKENADLIVSLRGAIFFDKKRKGLDQILSSIGIKDRQLVDEVFSSLMGSQEMNHIEYKIFNSIQDPANEQTENHYKGLQAKVAEAITDHVMSVMMTYVILFSSDFVQLENKKLIEKIQYNYLKLMEVYVYGNHPRNEARTVLTNALQVVSSVREMAEIKKTRSINQSACSQSAQYKV